LDRAEATNVLNQMKRVAASMGRQADDFIVGLIDKLDADKDGKITRKEWMDVGGKTPSLLVLLGVKKV
jgi:Ca2+-binding EF-hand superfamily protein